MTDAAVIAGSLVDVRNVGTHKSVKLTIHVPEEHALRVTEAFGWPTGSHPVSVAIARLDTTKAKKENGKERRRFNEMNPAQQAGLLCNDPVFHAFLHENHAPLMDAAEPSASDNEMDLNADRAASAVRSYCHVHSRAHIKPGSDAARKWGDLRDRFLAWRQVA